MPSAGETRASSTGVNEINWSAGELAKDAAKARPFMRRQRGPLGITAAAGEGAGHRPPCGFPEQIGALLDGGGEPLMFRDITSPAPVPTDLLIRALRKKIAPSIARRSSRSHVGGGASSNRASNAAMEAF